MRRMLAGTIVFGVIAALAANESFAQRGGRGGARGGAGPARSGTTPRYGPSGPASPGRPGGPGGPASPAGLGGQRAGPPGARPAASSVERFLGVNGPVTGAAIPAGQAVSHWNHLPYQPFTPAWYAAHPNAWQATHPHADLFVAATATSLAGWLAVPYATISASSLSSAGSVESAAAGAATSAPQQPPPDDLADVASAALANDEQWMPLGVFALRPAVEPQAHLVLQMAVSRDGIVRGSQFDTGSQKAQNITGAVDKKTLRVAWRSADNPEATFETALGELLKAEGDLVRRLPDDRREPWKSIQVSK